MTEHFITLSTTEPNNYVGLLKMRQGDINTQTIQATITANGQLFKFDRLSVFFNAVLPNGNVIRDKVTGVDYVNSKLNYVVADSFLQEVAQVTAWFSFENDEKIIDSTKNFQYSVIPGWKECIPQGNYIYELSEIQRQIEEIIGNKDFTSLLSKIDSLSTEQEYLNSKVDFLRQQKADKSEIDAKLSQISSVPETFANLAALKSTYPTGKPGLFVTADTGHKYIWDNSTWTDAGIYQSVGIADNSITPKYLTARGAPAFLAQNGSNQAVYERSKNTLHLNDSLVISKGVTYPVRGDVVLGPFGFIVFDQVAKNVAYATGDNIIDSMAILGTVYNGDLMLPGVNINDKNDVSPTIYIDQGRDPNLFTFDFNNMKIEYPEGNIYYGQKRYFWSQGSIDIPSLSVAEQYLILMPSTGKFRLSDASKIPSYSLPDEVVLGYIDTLRKQFYSTKIDPNLCKTIPENKGLIDRQQTFAYSDSPIKIDFDNKTAWLPKFIMNDQRAKTVIIDSKTIQLTDFGGWLTYDKSNQSYQFDQGVTPKRVGSDVLLMGWIDCQNHTTNGVWGNNWVDVTLGSSRIGANLYYLGDSITVGFRNSNPSTACYPNRIYQRTRVPYTSDAITGATVCGTESSSFVSRFKASDMSGTEKLIIFGGHNDFHVSKPLGTIESQNTTEFYGAYQEIINSALANNPALKIYLIAPNWRIVDEGSPNAENRYDIATFKNNAGSTFLDYIQAIKNIGDKYHLPVLNLYEDWGVYQGNNTAWLVDGLHPNVSGQRWLSNIIQGFIENN